MLRRTFATEAEFTAYTVSSTNLLSTENLQNGDLFGVEENRRLYTVLVTQVDGNTNYSFIALNENIETLTAAVGNQGTTLASHSTTLADYLRRIEALEGATAQTGNTSDGHILNLANNEYTANVITTQNNSAIKIYNNIEHAISYSSELNGEILRGTVRANSLATYRHSTLGSATITIEEDSFVLDPSEPNPIVIIESAGG